MSSDKSAPPLPTKQIVMISLVTLITWFLAFSGWKQALKIVNNTGGWVFPIGIIFDLGFFYRPVNIPCFFSTFLASPLPYCIYILLRDHWREYPIPRPSALIDKLIIRTLILATLVPLLGLASGLIIGLAGGPLDIMIPEKTSLFLDTVIYGSPITIPLTLVTLLILLIVQGTKHTYWWLLPASIAVGTAVFRLLFVLLFLLLGVPPT